MKISINEIISSTEVMKNFSTCREKTKELGKTFIFKNNQPDLVLMDIEEYKLIYALYTFLEEEEHNEIYEMVQQRRKNDDGKRVTLDDVLKRKDKKEEKEVVF